MKDLKNLKKELDSINYCIGGINTTYNQRDRDNYVESAVDSITDYLRELTEALIEIQELVNQK